MTYFEPAGTDVCDDDFCGPKSFCGHHVDETNGPGPTHQHSLSKLDLATSASMDTHSGRLTAEFQ